MAIKAVSEAMVLVDELKIAGEGMKATLLRRWADAVGYAAHYAEQGMTADAERCLEEAREQYQRGVRRGFWA